MAAKINPTTFPALKALCSDYKAHTIGHNTTARLVVTGASDVVRIEYHGNTIALLTWDRVSLYNSGWFTPTTKDRLNVFIPAGYHISQVDGVWYVYQDSKQAMEFKAHAYFVNGQLVKE